MAFDDLYYLMRIRDDLLSIEPMDASTSKLVHDVLACRSELGFDDKSWFGELTSHLVTIESSCIDSGWSEQERELVRQAVIHAVQSIQKLIDDKIEQLYR
ncbi:hypothetical protein [Mucisphaera sp.]|uniref:hypothetical protein n=1 Tax=Mucisphaera sp. TaxID=2913024 RepID=UPI003D0FA3A5